MDEKSCKNCKNIGKKMDFLSPCKDCNWEFRNWEPAQPPELIHRRADMGTPEGSIGVTGIIRQIVTEVDENWKITKYAVAGIRAELASLGLRLTSKDLPREEYWHYMDRLYTLTRDLSEYEERLEKIEKAAKDAKAGQVPKP